MKNLSLLDKINMIEDLGYTYKIKNRVYYIYKNEKLIKNAKYDFWVTLTDFIKEYLKKEC